MEKTLFAVRKTIMSYVKAGNPLIVATILALVAANLPVVSDYYFNFWNEEISLKIGDFNLFGHGDSTMNLMTFINDALMAIFFFTIGLEIKREVLVGELSSLRQALLPIIAAIGGMVVPIVIFHFLSVGEDYSRGAAIPMATDIAFSLGVLAMLGSRVPISLKIFLTTLAVVDDIGGILVIATCYTSEIHFNFLLYAGVAIAFLILGNIWKIQTKMYYILFGLMVWYCFLNSGIHPTIAGVIVAFCIPAVPVFNPKKYIQIIRRSISHFPTQANRVGFRQSDITAPRLGRYAPSVGQLYYNPAICICQCRNIYRRHADERHYVGGWFGCRLRIGVRKIFGNFLFHLAICTPSTCTYALSRNVENDWRGQRTRRYRFYRLAIHCQSVVPGCRSSRNAQRIKTRHFGWLADFRSTGIHAAQPPLTQERQSISRGVTSATD